MNLLRVRKSGVLSRHRHPQPVHAYVKESGAISSMRDRNFTSGKVERRRAYFGSNTLFNASAPAFAGPLTP